MLFPLGNMGYDFVETGNRLAARCALMLYYSLSYGCRWLPRRAYRRLIKQLLKIKLTMLKIIKIQTLLEVAWPKFCTP